MNEFKKINRLKKNIFVVAGGVAANKNIRKKIEEISKENNFSVFFPSLDLCGDNAAMIAMVGLEKFKSKNFDRHDLKTRPRWQLDENAKFLKGAGVKI